MTHTGTTPQLYIGVSTKMYMGYRASLRWLEQVRAELDARPALAAGRVLPFVIPSFPVLPAAADILAGTAAVLGAQNCSPAEGPWTGEVSASMLAELGVGMVELGHAERRRHFGEDDAVVAAKVRQARSAGITPLLCVGEQRRGTPAEAADFVVRQLEAALAGPPDGGSWDNAGATVVAYEPVWAIGAAEPADAGYVTAVVRGIRQRLEPHGAGVLPIIYGGSAKPGLLPQLDGVSGLFLGRFAHDAANLGRVLDEALAEAGPA
ncbi:triose-phosphate isomerase family protein [Arthrobacter sp. SDTb3-6]|uniref:triose-phosphate isomerase family protein n=1 Tax=Arthrobacter sp. SDTb3-6 TaxID=2713571 RepID=UPI00159DE0A6|nr:triose-phosphate isomerase family protein [Arthrobacter sp. SDTb3-6]NVM98244.1 triosephosphate isomerase [Arthrobacter sp. SDTb3-6]